MAVNNRGMNAPSRSELGANAQWQRRSLRHVWHPCTQMQRAAAMPPLPIARAQGPWLIDHEDRSYFDATSSWWVNLFGHSDPRINAALKDQIDRLPHVMLAGKTRWWRAVARRSSVVRASSHMKSDNCTRSAACALRTHRRADLHEQQGS